MAAALVEAAEHLAGPAVWGYDSAFLHVHLDNVGALRLYEGLGYEGLPELDEEPLAYFYKRLRPDAPEAAEVVAAARGSAAAR